MFLGYKEDRKKSGFPNIHGPLLPLTYLIK